MIASIIIVYELNEKTTFLLTSSSKIQTASSSKEYRSTEVSRPRTLRSLQGGYALLPLSFEFIDFTCCLFDPFS